MRSMVVAAVLMGFARPALACGMAFPGPTEMLAAGVMTLGTLAALVQFPVAMLRREEVGAYLARSPRAWCACAGALLAWPLTQDLCKVWGAVMLSAAWCLFIRLVVPLCAGVRRARVATFAALVGVVGNALLGARGLDGATVYLLVAAGYLGAALVPARRMN